MSKICTKCKQAKSIDEFHNCARRKDGKSSYCKKCINSKYVSKRKIIFTKEELLARKREAKIRYREKHPDRIKESREKYRKKAAKSLNKKMRDEYRENPNKFLLPHKKWRSENKDKASAHSKKWRMNNPAKCMELVRKRQAQKIKAMPKWANEFFISEIYALAKLRTDMLGIKFHVDHIIPLRGKTVCGLHVENNLQILTAQENIKKGNKLLDQYAN